MRARASQLRIKKIKQERDGDHHRVQSFFAVCIRKLIHDTDMCVSTDNTGGSINSIDSQKIQNNAARIVFKSPKHCHVSPLLRSLLPITRRIDCKLFSFCFSVTNGTGPENLSELLTIYTPSRQLRSASDTRLLRIPSFKTKTNVQRSFSFLAATVWNNLPQTVRYSTSISSFKSSLKTHLFSKYTENILNFV